MTLPLQYRLVVVAGCFILCDSVIWSSFGGHPTHGWQMIFKGVPCVFLARNVNVSGRTRVLMLIYVIEVQWPYYTINILCCDNCVCLHIVVLMPSLTTEDRLGRRAAQILFLNSHHLTHSKPCSPLHCSEPRRRCADHEEESSVLVVASLSLRCSRHHRRRRR